jgi:hypothetical protein
MLVVWGFLFQHSVANGEDARLFIQSPRPMAAAVLALSEQTGACINYEDPRYTFPGDVERLVPGEPILQPRVSGIWFTYQRDEETESVIRKLLDTHDQAGNSGRFKVSKIDSVFNVSPTHTRDDAGEWVPHESVLDRRISVSFKEVSYFEALQTVCSLASRAPFTDALGFGVNASNLLMQSRCTLDFQDESVRVILCRMIADCNEQLLHGKPYQLTWQARCGPKGEADNGNYVFTIVPVEREQRQSTKLFIEDRRPIAASLKILGETFDIRSGYEDPVFECACDLIGGVVPSGDQLRAGWDGSASASEIVEAVLSGTMRQNFSFTERNGRFRVFPTAVRDANGELKSFDALIGRKIVLPAGTAEATEVFSRLSVSLAAGSTRAINVGADLTSSAVSKEIVLPDGESRMAADVIDDAVKQIDEKLSWQLIHDPTTGNYTLEFAK